MHEALKTMQNALDTNDTQAADAAAATLEICATVTPTDTPPADDLSFAEVQNIIVRDDLKTATELLERVVSQLESGEETHVNRKGEAQQVAMRPDSVAKLVNAYATLSNLRANRGGIATQIVATERAREESGGGKTSVQLMAEYYEKYDVRTPSGRSMKELHDQHEASMKQ